MSLVLPDQNSFFYSVNPKCQTASGPRDKKDTKDTRGWVQRSPQKSYFGVQACACGVLGAYIQKAEKLAGTIWQPRKIGGKSVQILTTRFCDKRALIIKML